MLVWGRKPHVKELGYHLSVSVSNWLDCLRGSGSCTHSTVSTVSTVSTLAFA